MTTVFDGRGSGAGLMEAPTKVAASNVLDQNALEAFDFTGSQERQVAQQTITGSLAVKAALTETLSNGVQSTVERVLTSRQAHPSEADLSGFSFSSSGGMGVGAVSEQLAAGARQQVEGQLGVGATSFALQDRVAQEAALLATGITASSSVYGSAFAANRQSEDLAQGAREGLPPAADPRSTRDPEGLDPDAIAAGDREGLRPRDPKGFEDRREKLRDQMRMSPQDRAAEYRERLAASRDERSNIGGPRNEELERIRIRV